MPVPEYGSAEFTSWIADGTSTSSSAAAPIAETRSGSLPFGKNLQLSTISGPTYVTAQLLVQQVAYLLSDKIWSYSPESFDLDIAASSWSKGQDANVHGYAPNVQSMDIRSGAGSAALGYLFSKDFNIKRRHIPQAMLASSSALNFLRQALDQLSLLYGVTNPFVAHVAAATYEGKQGVLSADYISSMWLAEDLGYNLVCSHSAHESQHMSLMATLLAQDAPVLHTYDGIHMSRDTTRVIDILDKSGLEAVYSKVLSSVSTDEHKHSTIEGRTLRTIKALNDELGTDYKPFEYYGHSAAETVLVTFGSVESSLSAQVAAALANHGDKVGVINVRVYRPFIEESFLQTLPRTTKVIGVLGQVTNPHEVSEGGIRSRLYEDVLAAVSFNTILPATPEIRDVKAARSEVWSPKSIAAIYHMLAGRSLDKLPQDTLSPVLFQNDVRQYSFWNVDESSAAAEAPGNLAQALAKDSSQNVTVNNTFDNLVQGGVHRIDIRKSPKTLDATYPILAGDVAVITDATLLDKVDVLASVKKAGKLIVLLPGIKDEDVEKKISANARRAIAHNDIDLYLIDVDRSALDKESSELSSLVLQAAFLRVALAKSEDVGISKLAAVGESSAALEQAAEDLEKTLRQIEVPKEWADAEVDETKLTTVATLVPNSFAGWDKSELEAPSLLETWQKAAKGLLFKEAYKTQDSLRPDLPTKTYTVHVKENRRLTPLTYDRNIFHIEFDLGTSGLTYAIGEALGIHAENDPEQVLDFIKSYKLDAAALVEVPSRDDPSVLEIRTIYQALVQNVDIFGRPPKKFYESLADFATDSTEEKNLRTLAGPEGFKEFQRRAEVDTVTFADILLEFPSAHPSFHDLVNIVSPMKRREYSIASCQAVTLTSVALMVVVVNWVDPRGRDRFGQATQYLNQLRVGAPVTVSVKPSVMKLPASSKSPIIMAGLGTGLAPFRAFVQQRALEKSQGKEIGSVLLYMGSRHQREEYCYGEEWEAYQAAGVITLLGRAFSRDQPQKIYIQDRMRQTLDDIRTAYLKNEGSFYLCGPTWPVPDVTNVLEEAIASEWRAGRKTVKRGDTSKEIMKLKDDGRYVLEVY